MTRVNGALVGSKEPALDQGGNASGFNVAVFAANVDHAGNAQAMTQLGKHNFVMAVGDGH